MQNAGSVTDTTDLDYDVIIVGAGIGGLYSLNKLRGLGFRVRVIEAAAGVGGTWFWNRYPGARCDIESLQYSYSFDEELQQEWVWTERFAAQPEILRYIEHVADRFDLRKDIDFGRRVVTADYDEDSAFWSLTDDTGVSTCARYCVMATGCLSVPRLTVFPGEDNFAGDIYHTALWPHSEPDLDGKRIGVVGTSASGTQSIPHLAKRASHLTVFQRTANFSIPSRIGPVDPDEEREKKTRYADIREEQRQSHTGAVFEMPSCGAFDVDDKGRKAIFEERWKVGGLSFLRSFNNLSTSLEANNTAVDFVHAKMREKIRDQDVAEKLLPRSHPIGSRRICTDYEYYETFNRDNVSLVDVIADPIETITEKGIKTSTGEIELDAIVMATGFEVMTGALSKIDIRGRGGFTLRDKWKSGPKSYLGVAIAGFPNLFTQAGPLSPGTLGQFFMLNEQQGDWLADLLVHMRENDLREFEASADAEDYWVEHIQEIAKDTLHYEAPESSYFFYAPDGERVFLVYIGGFNVYTDICRAIADGGYKGFALRGQDGRETSLPFDPEIANKAEKRTVSVFA